MNRIQSNKSNKGHILRNLATSLILFEQVETTETKAKAVKSYVDKILSGAKTSDFNSIRTLNKVFFDKNAVKKIVEELIPRYKSRNSGFIRSYHLKNRLGDNASMMRLELIDKKVFVNKETQAPEGDKKIVSKSEIKEENTKAKVVKNAK
jgi:large subunit ribosomal protein L17